MIRSKKRNAVRKTKCLWTALDAAVKHQGLFVSFSLLISGEHFLLLTNGGKSVSKILRPCEETVDKQSSAFQNDFL